LDGCIPKCREKDIILQIKNIKERINKMETKEEFLERMGSLWDRLQDVEKQSTDMYEFEETFEKEINSFGQETMQHLIGSNNRDRRVKKNSKHDMEK
jgi:hypothetical protein